MASHITRYDLMPIPPVEEHTEWFEAGVVRIGVEYRVLDDAIAAASQVEQAGGGDAAAGSFDDSGVALHVCAGNAAERLEYLRFDCFQEDPHYHYVSWKERSNEMLHLDPVADGDPLSWALDRLRTRLPQMLRRAGAGEWAERVDAAQIEEILPRVAEAAWRARYHHDDAAIRAAALKGS